MNILSKSFCSPQTEEDERIKDSFAQEHVSQPQNLSEAMRYVVQQFGRQYLLNKNLINMLNDFHILKDIYEIYTDVVNHPKKQYQTGNRTNAVKLI
jgi:hypothetical protein